MRKRTLPQAPGAHLLDSKRASSLDYDSHGGVCANQRPLSCVSSARGGEQGVEFLLELVLYMLGEVISEALLELVCRGLGKVIEALCELFSAIG